MWFPFSFGRNLHQERYAMLAVVPVFIVSLLVSQCSGYRGDWSSVQRQARHYRPTESQVHVSYPPSKRSYCKPQIVTKYKIQPKYKTVTEVVMTTITEEETIVNTEYVTVTDIQHVTEVQTDTSYVTTTTTDEISTTLTEKVYETQVITETKTEEKDVTIMETKTLIQEKTVTYCPPQTSYPHPHFSYGSGHHLEPSYPTTDHKPDFGDFMGYDGFKGFDFKGFNPFPGAAKSEEA